MRRRRSSSARATSEPLWTRSRHRQAVSKQTVYKHFADKERLFVETVKCSMAVAHTEAPSSPALDATGMTLVTPEDKFRTPGLKAPPKEPIHTSSAEVAGMVVGPVASVRAGSGSPLRPC